MACTEAIGARVAASDDDHAFSGRKNFNCGINGLTVAALILLRQELHGEMNSFKLAARNFQLTRLLRPASEDNRVEVTPQLLDFNISADLGIRDKLHSFE